MSDTRKSAIRLLATSMLILGLSTCWSQTSTGGITGQVEDSQHNVVPGATVGIRNLQTNITLTLTSNDVGIYSATSLPAGAYNVTAEKAGFQKVVVEAVRVNIAATSKVDVVLPVGQVQETVTVDASGQLLTTENPTLTTVVPNVITSGLPYPAQSALEAVTLIPGVQGDPQYDMGVQSEDPGVYTQPVTTGGSLAIGGGRVGSTEQLVDGFDVTMIGYPRAGITFSGYTINQITVQSSGISAKYGRTGGGIINQSTAGGTSQYHGRVAYRHYDPFLEANTYGQSGLGQDVHQNMFTGTFGGPIPLPRLRKNTFFFASFEPLRASNKMYSRIRVPTPDELAGNFQNAYTLLNTTILKSSGYAAAIAAPRVGGLAYEFPINSAGFSTGVPYNSSSQYVPIPNNSVAPQLAQNPFAQYVLSLFPTPQKHPKYIQYINPDASYANDGNNALGNRGVVDVDNRYNIRVDHTFNNSDHIFGRYTNVPVTGVRYNYLGPDSPMDNSADSIVDSQNTVVDYAHIFSSKIMNDARASYLRMNYDISPAPDSLSQDYAKKFGLYPATIGSGFPSLSLDTGTYGSITGGNDGGISLNEAYAFGDDLSVLLGRHTLSFGGEFRAMQLNRLGNSGLYGGSYGFYSTKAASGGGNNTASFILGEVSSLTLAIPQPFYYRWKYGAAYVQDDWKIRPNLTLNLGVRYNLETPRSEAHGLQGSLQPNTTGTLNGVAATGAFVFAGLNGQGNTLWPTNHKGFEPRIGFAYQPIASIAVRASYSLIHAPLTGTTNSIIPSLITPALRLGGQFGGQNSAAYLSYMTNPLSITGAIPGVLQPQAPVFNTNFSIPDVPQNDAVPYVEAWSVSTQYQPNKNTLIEAAYSAQAAHHLFQQPLNENLLPLSTVYSELSQNVNLNATTTQNMYGLGLGNLNTNLVRYPQFFRGVASGFVRSGSSSYNAFYLSGSERLVAGLTVMSSFTWSKSIDDGSSGTIDSETTDTFGFAGAQNPYAPYAPNSGERSYSLFDVPVHFNAAYVWDIPVGRGALFNIQNQLLNSLLGGWSTSGIFSAQSGYPVSITLGSAGYFFSTPTGGTLASNGTLNPFNLRPNLVSGQPLIQKNWKTDPYGLHGGGFLNPAAFSVPGSVGNPQLGTAPRTLGGLRSPRTIYFDASARKSFSLRKSDRFHLILKMDAINALNHTDFFFNPNSGHSMTGSLNTTTGLYTLASGFGVLNSGEQALGRTVALGADFTF